MFNCCFGDGDVDFQRGTPLCYVDRDAWLSSHIPGNYLALFLQRRAAERAGKSKKIGVHYYETANVKNRNLQKRAEQRAS